MFFTILLICKFTSVTIPYVRATFLALATFGVLFNFEHSSYLLNKIYKHSFLISIKLCVTVCEV